MSDPLRQSDPRSGASPELRAALEHAQSSTPDAARVAALIGAVQGKMSAPVSAAPVKGALSGLGVKAALLVLGGALLAVGTYAALGVRQGQAPVRSSLAQPASPPTVLPSEPEVSVAEPALQPAAAAAPQRSKRARKPSPVASELGLLQGARSARKSSPETALRLLAEHEQRFPDGALREERDALQIQLLQGIDPRRAERLLRDFEQRYPSSAYRHSLSRPTLER